MEAAVEAMTQAAMMAVISSAIALPKASFFTRGAIFFLASFLSGPGKTSLINSQARIRLISNGEKIFPRLIAKDKKGYTKAGPNNRSAEPWIRNRPTRTRLGGLASSSIGAAGSM